MALGGGGGEGEGEEEEEEAGSQPNQFNQVMMQAQNRMVLIAVLSDQKVKVRGKNNLFSFHVLFPTSRSVRKFWQN